MELPKNSGKSYAEVAKTPKKKRVDIPSRGTVSKITSNATKRVPKKMISKNPRIIKKSTSGKSYAEVAKTPKKKRVDIPSRGTVSKITSNATKRVPKKMISKNPRIIKKSTKLKPIQLQDFMLQSHCKSQSYNEDIAMGEAPSFKDGPLLLSNDNSTISSCELSSKSLVQNITSAPIDEMVLLSKSASTQSSLENVVNVSTQNSFDLLSIDDDFSMICEYNTEFDSTNVKSTFSSPREQSPKIKKPSVSIRISKPNSKRFESVSRGSMDQSDNSLKSGGNLQCTVISCSAAAYSVVKNRNIFTTNDIDSILTDGNDTYVSYLNGQSPRCLDPEEVPTNLKIGNTSVIIRPPTWHNNGLFPYEASEKANAVENLANDLKNVFEMESFDSTKDSIIFTFQQYTVSCWSACNAYFLFNSHAVDQSGTKNYNHCDFNKARLFRVNDLKTLAGLLLIDGNHNRVNNQYSLHVMRVLSLTEIPENSSTLHTPATSTKKKVKKPKTGKMFNFHKTSITNLREPQKDFECVAVGSMHQSDASLASGGGLQCVIMSISASSLSCIKNRNVFTSFEIDTILRDGNNVYVNHLNGQPPHCLEPEEAPVNFKLGTYNVNIIPPEWQKNGLFPFEASENCDPINVLTNKLLNVFEDENFDYSKDSIIFTFQLYTVSCWISNNVYYLFNSHAVDENGTLNHNDPAVNKARLFKIYNIQTLAKLLLINGQYGRRNNEYSIHKLRMVDYVSDCVSDCESVSTSASISTTTSTLLSSNNNVNGKRKRRYKTFFGIKKQKVDLKLKYKKEHPEVEAAANKKYKATHPDVRQKINNIYKNSNKDQLQTKNKEYEKTKRTRNIPKTLKNVDCLLGELSGDMLNEIKPYNLKNVSLLSDATFKCKHCGARLFKEEDNRTFCCGRGKYNVVKLPPLTETFYEDPQFLKRSRAFNNLFAFSALGTSGHHVDEFKSGPYFLKIQGRTYHRIFDLSYTGTTNPLRFYVYDEIERYHEAANHKLNREIVTEITHYIHDVNPYIDHFKRLSLEQSDNAFLMLQRGSRETDGANLGSNVTANTEIAALISCDESDIVNRSVVVWKVGQAKPHTIDLFGELYEPLHYTLLYPHGTPGWHLNKLDNMGKKLTQLEYYRYLMLTDYRFSELGRLSEEWIVDMFSRVEEDRLNYFKKMQSKWRTAPLNELTEADVPRDIINDETIVGDDGNVIPGRIFLPNTFTGGPRYMQTKFMDGIALVNRLGRPSYFLTFTCNPNWPEIVQSRRPNHNNSPLITARVFKLKLMELMRDLRNGAYFGKSVYIMYMIEYQKRGLPHAHICFRVEGGGPVQNADIDKIIRADIPLPEEANGRLRELVLRHMIHGPCGVGLREDIPCWKGKKKCERFFPKIATETTYADDRGFVNYKRNPKNEATIKYGSKQFTVSDQWVVAYNAAILLKYDAHINIEIAATRKIVKYIFKYMTKGPDQARVAVVAENNTHATGANGQSDETANVEITNAPESRVPINEIEEYATKRFLGSCECTWRMLEYPLCEREPTIIQLPIHLEGQQSIVFQSNKSIPSADNASSKLLIYFRRPLDSEFDNITYETFYENYMIHSSKPPAATKVFEIADGKHYVTRRVKGERIARLYWAPPKRGELFYLRMLLKVYPCRNYSDLIALGGPDCTTFQQVARHVGLADDEQEYERALSEASTFYTGRKLRNFYVLLICNGAPALILWEKFKDALSEDHFERDNNREKATYTALVEIDRLLRKHGSCARDQGLPQVFDDTTELSREHLLYNTETLRLCEFVEHWLPKLSIDQKTVFDHVNYLMTNDNHLAPGAQTAIFIDGASGTGKTLLLNLIAAHVRGTLKKVALCTATSGIAALNYEGGTTAHSMFKLPIDYDDDKGVWGLTNTSQRANLIRNATVIIFDEAPMCNKSLIHILDNSLRDLMQCSTTPFGGKIIIFAGDFRQIPPVVISGKCPNDTIQTSLRMSPLWPLLHKFVLTQAQRTRSDDDYSSFLLNLGSGLLKVYSFGNDSSTQNMVSLENLNTCTQLADLIDFVFPDEIIANPDLCAQRAIITTHNINVRNINRSMIERIPGEPIHLYSVDTVEDDIAHEFHLGADTLNLVETNKAPDHHIVLKKGCVCIIIRNLNFNDRLVNGTKVIVVDVTPIKVTVRKPNDDEIFFIPRITFQAPVEPGSPVTMNRRQFPLQLCYAMTVHKAQGQTISKVGVDLRSDVFIHGQLYVALGRVRNREDILILVNTKRIFDSIPYANNVIYHKLIN